MTVYKPKRSNFYYMDFVINGQRIYRSTRKLNKIEALVEEEKERKRLTKEQKFDNPLFESMPTLEQAMQKVYETRWSENKTGWKSYNQMMTTISEFGNPFLDQINAEWNFRLRTHLRKTRAPATVNRYLAALRTVLRVAYEEWEIIDRVPKVKLFSESKGRTRVITEEEQSLMCLVLRNNKELRRRRKHWPFVADLIDILCETGMRANEALKLNPNNFRVSEIIQLWPDETKTGEPRAVPITDRAAAIFNRLGKNPFKGIDIHQADQAFAAARKQLDIDDPEFCLHACRHTFASRLLATGEVDLFTIKILLGHASYKTTERYSHLSTENLKRAVSYLSSI